MLLNSRGADCPDEGPLAVGGEGGLNLTDEAVCDAVDAGLGGGRLGGCPCRQNQPHRLTAAGQVWSLSQFYSVDFSKSRMGVNKCVFNKRTIKVCVSCC